ncbi:MAG: uncharacterized protein JWP13_753 [Candidatus Saccharibacteria bacterium]|nr:uncharacterized protein [Candidatus Saccharibacteria bacterium]
MNLITTATLHDLGIHKSDDEEQVLVEHFETTLNERVGMTVIDLLDDDQAKHLMELSKNGDQEETTAWLQKNIPEFEQIAQDEYDILLGELAESADKI